MRGPPIIAGERAIEPRGPTAVPCGPIVLFVIEALRPPMENPALPPCTGMLVTNRPVRLPTAAVGVPSVPSRMAIASGIGRRVTGLMPRVG